VIYYVYDAMAPYTSKFNTLTEAMACGEAIIEEYRGHAIDGWGDINIGIYACEKETDEPDQDGKEVAAAVEYTITQKPEDVDDDSYSKSTGEWWNPDWDYTCDYRMELTP